MKRFYLHKLRQNPLAWDWIRENWEILVRKKIVNDFSLTHIIAGTTSSFATEAKRNEVEGFFNDHIGAYKSHFIMALNAIDNNIEWIQENGDKLEKWLDAITQK